MSATRIVRNVVVQCWGTPAVTVGSVNEPREGEEHGHRFNEKWIYRLPHPMPDAPCERHVYWFRYDFVASYLVTKSGELVSEDLGAAIAEVEDRRYHPRRAALRAP